MKYLNLAEVDVSLNTIINEVTASQSETIITRDGLSIARIIPWQTTTETKNYP